MSVKQSIFLNGIPSFSSALNIANTHSDDPSNTVVMSGKFRHQAFHNGLMMHASDATEQLNTQISAEMPPSISFNFLFSGVINYSFGSQQYQLSNPNADTAQGSFIISNQHEIFTRHMTKGMHIKKLNIFVEKDWLTNRCGTKDDYHIVEEIFRHPNVYHWQPSIDAINKAEALITLGNATTLAEKLTSEQLTMELLIICLEEVHQLIRTHNALNKDPIQPAINPLKSTLDQYMNSGFSLAKIAKELNISVSTLQRRFKRTYGLNISNYMKQHRLAVAKKSLLIDGNSIGEVAFETGYNHTSNFINAFRNQFGVTPAAYVKLHKLH